MPWVGFEPTISAGERPKTYVLDRAATETDLYRLIQIQKCYDWCLFHLYLHLWHSMGLPRTFMLTSTFLKNIDCRYGEVRIMALKMEAVGFSETLVNLYPNTKHELLAKHHLSEWPLSEREKAIKYFYSCSYGLTCQLRNKIRGKLDIKIWARHVSGTHQETRKSSLKADLESQKLSIQCRRTEPCITQLQKLGLDQLRHIQPR